MTENAIVLQTGNDFLVPAASLEQVLATYQWKKDFIESVLKVNVDYGVTPGTSDKPSLKKPGAEKMASFFGLAPVFEDVATVEDWTGEAHGNEPFFYYRQKCKLYRGDRLIASADGSCNSWEKKYRYRSTDRVCPTCGKATIFKSKRNPEWYCWDKKGGCGATFKINDERIVNQETGQVKNPDVAELTNTILKMSQKRALVAAVLIATNASDYFTQDLDDFVTGEIIDGTVKPEMPKPTSGNPDPIDDTAWGKWEALCIRANSLGIEHPNPKRETTLKAELRAAYIELDAFVKDAMDQQQAIDPA
jgi:predicted RNA-binding Zn-ribbon protein involved in translation (DUF1610 family)